MIITTFKDLHIDDVFKLKPTNKDTWIKVSNKPCIGKILDSKRTMFFNKSEMVHTYAPRKN